MQERFGHDFSRVRIHTGRVAEQSAQDMNAHAYTVGHDVVFAAGQFAPETNEGRRLIAHELTHVVQQSGADRNQTGRIEERPDRSPCSEAHVTIQRETATNLPKEPSEEKFPWIGRIHGTYSAALRSAPRKNPDDPHAGTIADLITGTFVNVLGRERGWLRVRASIGSRELEGYVSQELVVSTHTGVEPSSAAGPSPVSPDPSTYEDPRKSSRYIDTLFRSVTYSMFTGASVFHWQEGSKEQQIGIPFTDLEQDDTQTYVPILKVHNSRDEALKTVNEWATMTSSFRFYSFYRTTENVIMPTSFSIASTPEFHKLWPGLKTQSATKAAEIRRGLRPIANVINPIPGTSVDEYGNLSMSGNPLDWIALLKLRRLSKIKEAGPITRRRHSGYGVPYTVLGPHDKLRGTSVYVLRDAGGTVLYVGKGGPLNRLREHIKDPKKTEWFGEISQVEVRATDLSNTQALALEESLIGQLKPRHNVDKNPFRKEFGNTMEVGPNLPASQKSLRFWLEWGH